MTESPTAPYPSPNSSPNPAPRRATVRFMLAHPAHAIALGFGSGLSPVAPGTAGTLWAWVAYLVMQQYLNTWQLGAVIAASTAIGWWACTVCARNLQATDPSNIVWDEVVAFWLILWLLTPAGFWAQAAAFALFRYFDAVKPGPVGWADSLFHGFGWKGGFGILFDDFVAAFCALFVIALWRFMV